MARSSKSFLFPDVNVWIALTYQRHIHHLSAKRWYELLDGEARLCFCRFTQISFLRLLNTTAVMGNSVMNQAEAWHVYDRWIEDGGAVFLEEPTAIETSFRAFSWQVHPSPKDWADSYLAAFASTAGVRLVSFDQVLGSRVERSIILR